MENKKDGKKADYVIPQTYAKPLIRIPKGKGYGYYGALSQSTDGETVQCHICGEWFAASGTHAWQKHNITIREYKRQFGLAYTTALISENERQRRKQRMLDWLNSLTEEELKEYRKNCQESSHQANLVKKSLQPEHQLETKNKRGTCPDQLLNKIEEVKKKLGRVPTLKEFIWECGTQKYKHLIFKIFGSWKKALYMLGYKANTPKTTKGRYHRYTTEELLEYLQIYAQENNKIPTATDCRRGLLPTYNVFLRRFGNMENARQEAEVYSFIN